MAKLSKEDLIKKINDKLSDNLELATELMEDVTDSFEGENTELETKYNDINSKYNDLLIKYRDRFLGEEDNSSVSESGQTEIIDDSANEEIIDVQEI